MANFEIATIGVTTANVNQSKFGYWGQAGGETASEICSEIKKKIIITTIKVFQHIHKTYEFIFNFPTATLKLDSIQAVLNRVHFCNTPLSSPVQPAQW